MLINDFKLVKQKKRNSCGYATAEMILSYLNGKTISEDFLCENEPFGEAGITFSKLLEVYRKHLTGYRAELVFGNEDQTRNVIQTSLTERIPLHILYLTENLMGDGEPSLHHSALIGYDGKRLAIADPYGSFRMLDEDAFFNAVSFRQECLPEAAKKAPSNLMIRFLREQ